MAGTGRIGAGGGREAGEDGAGVISEGGRREKNERH